MNEQLDENFYACTTLVRHFSFNIAKSEDSHQIYFNVSNFLNEITALYNQKKIDYETYHCCNNAAVEIADDKMKILLTQ